ncbi:hypothetical protein [Acetobacter nitrogenifigens]|nr:hypothetical protein [Acetobacter nitrogenifigens]
MPPIRRFQPPPDLPKMRKPKGIKLAVMAVLAVVYVVGIWALSHRPARKTVMAIVDIPVDVVKTHKSYPPPPPIIVTLVEPTPVVIPPPRLVIRGH